MYRSGVLLGRALGSLHDLPMTSMRSTERAKGLYSPVQLIKEVLASGLFRTGKQMLNLFRKCCPNCDSSLTFPNRPLATSSACWNQFPLALLEKDRPSAQIPHRLSGQGQNHPSLVPRVPSCAFCTKSQSRLCKANANHALSP